jgi:hypothetical protein
MADSNMTIGAELGETTSGRKSRLRKVTFTETTAGAGNATTTFTITGKLLRYITSGGDAEWQFVLNDGTANIFSSGNLTATATSGALYMHVTVPHEGIPLVDQTLKLSTTNSGTTAAAVTIIWEESETMR